MFTCDGYSYGADIIRFFSHEYDELLLNSLSTSKDMAVRTNSNYWKKNNIIWKVFEETRKVLKTFSISGQLTPFHFEWFVDVEKENVYFCEAGKRFGGGDIPFLIEYAFNVDILKEYWSQLTSENLNLPPIKNINDLLKPNVIATTYTPYTDKGKLLSVPDPALFDWTKNTWFFAKKGDETGTPSSVSEILLVTEFISDNEKEYKDNLSKLRKLRKMFIYEALND